MSELNTQETEENGPNRPTDLPRGRKKKPTGNQPADPVKSQTNIEPEDLFSPDPLLDQVEQQVSLLTSAMTKNMLLATGAAPNLSQGRLPKTPGYGTGYGKPQSTERVTSWADARSLHLRDAARLSFATASLIGAYAKLKGPAAQRFTTRHTIIPDVGGGKKPRQITTITHHLIASPNVKPVAGCAAEHATQQG